MTVSWIAIDAMGGGGVAVTVPACLQVLADKPNIEILLFGDQAQIEAELTRTNSHGKERLHIEHTDEVVEDDDTVAVALKNKKLSSMRLAINAVKDGRAQACVSGGNTGALMAISRFVLKTIPGIDRPAIMAILPTFDAEKGVRLLDLGANVDSPPHALLQFAMMGSVLSSAIDNIASPRVALLNIGEESHKGNATIQEASAMLQNASSINYTGFIEPNWVFSGQVDVVVCDGFIGNIALKSMEGSVHIVKHYIRQAYTANWFNKLLGLISKPVTNRISYTLSTSRRNGATLVGLNGVVIKSHGNASIKGFANAIKNAYDEAQLGIPNRIAHAYSALTGQ